MEAGLRRWFAGARGLDILLDPCLYGRRLRKAGCGDYRFTPPQVKGGICCVWAGELTYGEFLAGLRERKLPFTSFLLSTSSYSIHPNRLSGLRKIDNGNRLHLVDLSRCRLDELDEQLERLWKKLQRHSSELERCNRLYVVSCGDQEAQAEGEERRWSGGFVIAPSRVAGLQGLCASLPDNKLGRDKSGILYDDASTFKGDFRIMTYNIHGCLGVDGEWCPARVVEVINEINPDVVALQEVVEFSESREQSGLLSLLSSLGYDCWYVPAWSKNGLSFGNALLTRIPMKRIKWGTLPYIKLGPWGERRIAMWAEIEVGRRKLAVFNSHLGLLPCERKRQISTLLGGGWLREIAPGRAVVFCVDLNAESDMMEYRMFKDKLVDVQDTLPLPPSPTWGGGWFRRRLDYILISPGLTVLKVFGRLPASSYVASDHKPLVAELAFI